MSAWTGAAIAVTLALGLVLATIARGSIATRLACAQLAGALFACDLLLVAQSFGNESAYDVAFSLALLSLPSGLVYARFYGRWL